MPQTARTVTFQGRPLGLVGPELRPGQDAPDATLLANDLSPFRLGSLKGKIVVLSVVPSIDTSVCDTQVRRFNEEAASLADNVVVLAVSMDLPFAQARWCGAAGIDRVQTLSDHREGAFGKAYGVLIEDLRLLARAVFIIDAEGVIRYVQVVPEVTEHPDYAAAVATVRRISEES